MARPTGSHPPNPALPAPPEDIECLVFDWDGTLADSQDANYHALADVLRGQGAHLPRPWFDARTGLSGPDVIREFIADTGITLQASVEDLARRRDEAFLRESHRIREIAPVADCLRRAHGRRRTAIATGSSLLLLRATRPFADLAPLVDVVVTREDVRRGKPAPDLFLAAAERLRIPPGACLVYEDSDEGLRAAEAAGMPAVDVRPYRTGPDGDGSDSPATGRDDAPGPPLA